MLLPIKQIPPLDVIVLTYNQPTQLNLILEGYRRQTDQNFCIHVVNDGGDDASHILEKFSDLTCTYQEMPPSEKYMIAEARNMCLKQCFGKRVLFNDGDSIPAPNMVEVHAQYHDRLVAVVSERAMIPKEYAHRIDVDDLKKEVHSYRYNQPNKVLSAKYPQLNSYSLSVPAQLTKAIGGFWEVFQDHFGADAELTMRLEHLGCELLIDCRTCSYHIGHDRPWLEREAELKAQAHALIRASRDLLPNPVRNSKQRR